AWALAQAADLPAEYKSVRRVVCLGMGGSAMGASLVQGLAAAKAKIPLSVVRGYDLPAFAAGPETLVVACSYSGNTEETLSALDQALQRGVRLAAITTGGKLAALAEKRGMPLLRFQYAAQPRAALGYSFILLLGMLSRLGLLGDYSADLDEAAGVMEAWQAEIAPAVPPKQNLAKALAKRTADRLPVTYGAGFLAPVANRWKTQFNENSKHWAFFEEMPELNHNAVVGYGFPEEVRDRTLVVMLRSSFDHPRVAVRFDVTQELLQREGVATETVEARGGSRLAHVLSLIHFGDYVSYYLAMLNGADPSPVETIAYLKGRLAEAETSRGGQTNGK
ncbi:MAG: bifunctional phosphoglucose/phosphomannose isomerase, partial [Anaerolineales bacterium]